MKPFNKLIAFIIMLCLAPALALAQGTTNYPGTLDDGTSLPQAVDFKFTYLTSAITTGGTTLTVNSTAGLPSVVILQVDSELMAATVATGTTFTVTRGFSGTTAAAHAVNATVRFPIASANINGPRDAVLALEAKVGAGSSNASGASTGHVLTKQGDGTTVWAAVPAAGTVTSVGLALPAEFSVTGSPVTTAGTLTGAWATQPANQVLASPNGSTGPLAVRALAEADIPALAESKVTGLVSDLAGKQPLDSDLTAIAALTPTTDNFIQSKAGAWSSRTVAQVKTDLGLSGTNTGDQTSIAGITGTTAQFNTALTDNDFATLAGSETLANKTLTTPTIGSFTNATHTHQTAGGGGTLDAAAIAAGTVATARLGAGTASSSTYLRGDQTWAALPASVGGSGTTGTIPKFSAASTVADSIIRESSGAIGIGTGTINLAYKLNVFGHLKLGSAMSLVTDAAASGELPAGGFFGSLGTNGYGFAPSTDAGAAGAKVVGAYYNGSSFLSAIEWANVAGGTATVSLVKSGGAVEVGGTLKLGASGTAKALERLGTCTLTAGTCTVSEANVAAGSKIFLTAQDNSTTGALRISARSAATSFTITSNNASDAGVVAWHLIN